jgi:hypothetical protein
MAPVALGLNGNASAPDLPDGRSRAFSGEVDTGRVKKMRYNNDLEVLSDSAESENL